MNPSRRRPWAWLMNPRTKWVDSNELVKLALLFFFMLLAVHGGTNLLGVTPFLFAVESGQRAFDLSAAFASSRLILIVFQRTRSSIINTAIATMMMAPITIPMETHESAIFLLVEWQGSLLSAPFKRSAKLVRWSV